MFSKDKQPGRAICLEDYARVHKGAIVPESNELYEDVEAWIAEGNALAGFDGYPDVPMNEDQLQNWRESAVVSPYQGLAALDHFGYLEQVETLMTDPNTPKLTRLAFERTGEWRRGSSMMQEMITRLELTGEQADEMFRYAMNVEA